MTELLINGHEVVLSEGFSITVIEENPRYTKNGKKTYDVTISLKNAQNAKIYNHRNRINWKKNKLKERSAYLVVDNEVVLNGTEDILKWDHQSVTIQLLSGNSELNFLIGGDKKVRELSLGEADVYKDMPLGDKQKKVFDDLHLSYPDRDWQFVPYCTGDSDVNIYPDKHETIHIGNHYLMVAQKNWGPLDTFYPTFYPFRSGSVPQPYLCFVIKRVIEALGYTFAYNAIAEHPVLKNLYIVHGFRTTYFAKMLPSWTVEEFLDNIEKWLDCTFIVNARDKSVKLLFNYQEDLSINGSVDLESLDEYEVENYQDDDKSILQSNVGYALDGDKYYKYMKLDDKIKSHPEYILSSFSNVPKLVSTVNNPKYEQVNVVGDEDDRFIYYRNGDFNSLRNADSFRNLYNNIDSEDIDIEHNIIPAAMNIAYMSPFAWTETRPEMWIQIPIAGDYDPLIDKDGEITGVPDESLNIQSVVEGDSTVKDEVSFSKMRLAIYSGMQEGEAKVENMWGYTHLLYPIGYVESLAEFFPETLKERYYGSKNVNPFRWKYLNDELYKRSANIDTSTIYRIDFICREKIDIMSRFVANNKLFRCVKIERTITSKGFKELARGEFYAVDV